MDWTRPGLAQAGFRGFVPFADLPNTSVPRRSRLYLVLRPNDAAPQFREQSLRGWSKGWDPSVSVADLKRAWLPAAAVVYIGKAAAGASGSSGGEAGPDP
jgi:hypothetical protein